MQGPAGARRPNLPPVSLVLTVPCCAVCGSDDLAEPTVRQDALFRHGGYGETRAVALRVCGTCGAATVRQVKSERPPR